MTCKKLRNAGVLAMSLALSSLAGCDKISAWYDNATGKTAAKTTSTAPAATPSTPTPQTAELPKDVVARVGSWSISLDDFNDRLTKLKTILPDFDPNNTNSKKLILEELIRQQLLVMDAEQTGVAQQKEIVDTVEDFRKTLLVQELASTLTKDIQATEADALDYYNKNKKDFLTKAEWKVREIVVADEGQAKDILMQLLQGADFADTAKAKSKSATAVSGGDLGFVTKFPFEQMQNVVASLEVGKLSSVFRGPGGYYIVKLEDKKGGEPKDFAAVKDDLIKRLTLRKQQEVVLDHLNKLAGKTKIQVNEELLK